MTDDGLMTKFLFLLLILLISSVHANETADIFMELMNDHRHALGLSPLIHDQELAKVAFDHSKAMAKSTVEFGHDGFSFRCSKARKILGGGNWCAENVARGQKTMLDAFKAWMNSPGHRANLEQARATHTGLAFATTSGGRLYWTQLFIER